MAKKLTKQEKIRNLIEQFRSAARNYAPSPGKAKQKSEEWIHSQMSNIKSHRVAKPEPGKIYMFGYSAKYKDTLPYWDKYPLIICIGLSGKHMLGLNLHYIPPKLRQEYLEGLLKYLSNKIFSNNSRLRIDWSKVKDLRYSRHMIKMYLSENVRMGMQEVKPSEWVNVIYLRTQKFVNTEGKNISATRAYNDRNKRG